MSFIIGTYSHYDEPSNGYDTSYRSGAFQIDRNEVSFGELSAVDKTDWYQLNLRGPGTYTVFVSNDATNNYSANNFWGSAPQGIEIQIVDRFGTPLPGLDKGFAGINYDGSIEFKYDGGNSFGDYFVKVSNLGSSTSDYVLGLSLGALAGHHIDGSFLDDRIVGTNGNDDIYAGAGWDTIIASPGDDYIAGGSGVDSIKMAGRVDDYLISGTLKQFRIEDQVGNDGIDTANSIERLLFSDGAIAFDIDGDAGQAYRLYQAAFARKPDLLGLGYWIDRLDHGDSLNRVADAFYNSAEFRSMYGHNVSTHDFIVNLYQNVLHRAPDGGGFDYWSNQLNRGKMDRAEVLLSFSESAENQAQIIGQIQDGIDYVLWT